MLLLRRTWNPVFSSTKLYELDVCLNQIDPKWPIVKPKAALPIYDRPKYISLTVSEAFLSSENSCIHSSITSNGFLY